MYNLESSSPLVSFAILTYNQRDYIVDAISSVLSQDYPALEVIVSDDGSTDGTFELIKSTVSAYKGPHSVVINQTKSNRCVLGHFFEVVDLAKGGLLILAAGDDISYPSRTREQVSVWLSGSVGIFSNYDLMDSFGHVLKNNYSPNVRSEISEDVFHNAGGLDMHGASSAYDLGFVRSLPRTSDRFFFEDTFMTFMINFYGAVITKINKPLVMYRTHPESISNNITQFESIAVVINKQMKAAQYSLNKYDLYCFMRSHAVQSMSVTDNAFVDLEALDLYMLKQGAKGRWIGDNFFARLSYLFQLRRDRGFIYWICPRILGVYVFSLARIGYSFFNKVLQSMYPK